VKNPGQIFVVNKWAFEKEKPKIRKNSLIIYIGRPTLLGNEWDWKPNSVAKYKAVDREDSIHKYSKWIKSKIKKRPNPIFYVIRDMY